MLLYIAIALGLIAVALLGVGLALRDLVDELRKNTKKLGQIHQAQLNPRTRISQAAMQSGPETQEQQLAQLGRAVTGRRVVVGGDPDSQLYTNLNTLTDEEDDDE